MIITVRITKNYGNRAVYPVCETSKKLADLLGTRTFTDSALRKIAGLGYTIRVQAPEPLFTLDDITGVRDDGWSRVRSVA